MASSETLAVVLGALGVGGFLLYRHAKKTGSQCETVLQSAAKLVGYDLLPGMNDAGASKLICGIAKAAPELGRTVAKAGSAVANTVGGPAFAVITTFTGGATTGSRGGTSSMNGLCSTCCPKGSKPGPFLGRDEESAVIRQHDADGSATKPGAPCISESTGEVVGYLWNDGSYREGGLVPKTADIAPPPAVPVTSPLTTTTTVSGRTVRRGGGGGVLVT